MKNNIFIGTIAILFLFASCKTVQYQEFGSFGGGSMTAKQSVTSSKKIVANNESNLAKSTSSETSLLPCESNLTQINKVVKFGHSEKTKNQALAKKHTKINIKQALKLIPKIKSIPTKQLLKEIKHQKQIFRYEGDNNAMTFGFNCLIYGLMALLTGIISLGIDATWPVYFFGPFGIWMCIFGFLGSFIGLTTWISGWLFDNAKGLGIVFLSLIGLGILVIIALAGTV